MKKEELAMIRGIFAGVTLTYACTGHLFLAGVTAASWTAMEAGIKKVNHHKNIPYVDPNQPVQAEA